MYVRFRGQARPLTPFRGRGAILLFLLLMGAALACSLSKIEETPVAENGDLVDTSAGPPPTVQIIAPASGQQVRVGDDVEIRVSASDPRGVTRLQLSVSGRNSSTKSFPERAESAEALLRWRPDREGTFELSVVAFRNTVFSDPATINLQVVGRGDTVSNPASGQEGVAAATTSGNNICTARVLIGNLRIRTGPGTQFSHEGNFDLNETLTVIGQNADNSWVKIRRLDGSERWVITNSEWIEITGSCNNLPVVES